PMSFRLPGGHPSAMLTPSIVMLEAGLVDQSETAMGRCSFILGRRRGIHPAMGRPTDPAIEEIEAQLRESRLKAWDVETFLAKRHQAKIEALNAKIETLNEPRGKWIAAKDIAMAI